jgi:pyruvate dehydrogenase E2 component (dihydrolipoamide acetyltransferase)
VIHPPQVALVGAGRIADRPVVVAGRVVARPTVHLTLAADHRASDGQTGSRLLRRIAAHLQEPDRL